MFTSKKNIIVAITTFDLDALRLSVPPLRMFTHRAHLVIHNDNPNARLDKSALKKFGIRGDVHIINANQNRGELESRLAIIDYVRTRNIDADWIVFVNDDDVIINIDAPDVSKNTFAVVQNSTMLSDNITDIFKISASWATGTQYGATAPRFDITGALLRTMFLSEFADFIKPLLPQMYKIANSTRYRVPWGAVMWAGLNTFMRYRYPQTAPIYMNRTNYVAIKMGRATKKYGRTIPIGAAAQDANTKILRRYNELFEFAIKQNLVAPNQ